MSNKNKFLEKKYSGHSAKTTLLYFYLPCIKANEIRKLRRSCFLNHMRLIFLPSLFAFTNIKASHGPSIVGAITQNLSFPDLAFANNHQVSSFSLENKYNLHFQEKEKHEHPKSYASKIATVLQKTSKKLSEN